MKQSRGLSVVFSVVFILSIVMILTGCGSGGGGNDADVSCKGDCDDSPELLKSYYGTYIAELSGDWEGIGTLIMSDTPYLEEYQAFGVSNGASDWLGWLQNKEYADSQGLEGDSYVIYFDFMMPTYFNSYYIGDKRQEIWIYIDMAELEKGILKVTYKHNNEVNGETTGDITITDVPTPDNNCNEARGLPLIISDLQFPDTVQKNSTENGSVAFQGNFNSISNPVMSMQIRSGATTITTTLIEPPSNSNCRLYFKSLIPEELTSGKKMTLWFRLLNNVEGPNDWDDNAVSNEIPIYVTVN